MNLNRIKIVPGSSIMRSRTTLIALALLLWSVASTAVSEPSWFANLQLKITDVVPVEITGFGLFADVPFEGSASGASIRKGTVVGVDHALFDPSGNAHLDAWLTITDKNGDTVSANIVGLATYLNPGQYVLEGTTATIVNEADPLTGTFHSTTGKFAHMIGDTFDDVGFISSFSIFPPAGSVHVKWYYQ